MHTPTPDNILALALSNPIVHGSLEYWRHGHLTWEQALMLAITLLAHENEELEKNAVKDIPERPTINHHQL